MPHRIGYSDSATNRENQGITDFRPAAEPDGDEDSLTRYRRMPKCRHATIRRLLQQIETWAGLVSYGNEGKPCADDRSRLSRQKSLTP
jgi:hypothetical protein